MNKIERMNKAIDDLLEKAEKATAGPWLVVEMPGQGTVVATESTPGGDPVVCAGCRPQDAAYIAACDPVAIRAIIRSLRKQLEASGKALAALTDSGRETTEPQELASLELEAQALATWLANAYLGRDLLPEVDNGMSPPDPSQLREAARNHAARHQDPETMPLRGVRLACRTED